MATEVPDETLMALCAAGSEEAFATLVHRHQLSVYRYFVVATGDRERAWDLFQETFLRVYRHRERFRPDGKFRHWLFRIAGNLARSDRRRRQRRGSPESLEVADPPDPVRDPADAASVAEEVRRLREALPSLPEAQGAALRMRWLEGRSFEEIGAALGCPVGTAKSRVFYAIQSLRRRLAGGEGDDRGRDDTDGGGE